MTGRYLIVKVHIGIIKAFKSLSIDLRVIEISINGLIFIFFNINFLSGSEIIRWHLISILLLKLMTIKLSDLVLSSVMSIGSNINHHNIIMLWKSFSDIDLFLTSNSGFISFTDNIRSIFRKLGLIL